jgi:hypothetical protein
LIKVKVSNHSPLHSNFPLTLSLYTCTQSISSSCFRLCLVFSTLRSLRITKSHPQS